MATVPIKEFYDRHARTQLKAGVNERHHRILELAIMHGLENGARVLEMGCGVGSLTGLLAERFPRSNILAVDVSSVSINTARKALAHRNNIQFAVADIITDPINGVFDMIILPDVLEHIPDEMRPRLFVRLKQLLAPPGTILIHSPEPYYAHWIAIQHPELLQVVDLPLHLPVLISEIHQADLLLHAFQRHCIWTDKPDYMALVLLHPPEANRYENVTAKLSIVQILKGRLKRLLT